MGLRMLRWRVVRCESLCLMRFEHFLVYWLGLGVWDRGFDDTQLLFAFQISRSRHCCPLSLLQYMYL